MTTRAAVLHSAIFPSQRHFCPEHKGWFRCTDVYCGVMEGGKLVCQDCFAAEDAKGLGISLEEYYR